MMEAVREWITTVVMTTMLISVAQTMVPEGRIRKIFSFSGGLVLMLVLLQPVLEMDPDAMTWRPESYEKQIRACREELEQSARTEWETIIEQETTAYILEKADSLGMEISVEVQAETGEEGLPVLTAELTGEPSEILEKYLAEELGIPRERQVWSHERKN